MLTNIADLLPLFHSVYFSLLLIFSRITIIIYPLSFFSLFAKEASVDISIRALMCSERPTVPNFSRQAASEKQARASPLERGLYTISSSSSVTFSFPKSNSFISTFPYIHSALTSRIFPDSSPPSIRFFSSPSYSPVHSLEESPPPSFPANSTTSSMEFIDEVPIPPSQPRYYYYYDSHQPLDTLILRSAPLSFLPLIPLGPYDFDLSDQVYHLGSQDPNTIIPVFLLHSPLPYEVSSCPLLS